jgi:ATP-dependent DNA helicase RecG
MRPLVLEPIFKPVSTLPGVGPKIADLLARLTDRESADDTRIVDLLFLLPHSIVDRRKQPEIAYAAEGSIATLKVRVDRHQPAPRGRGNVPYRVYVHDDTGEMALTFFHSKAAWLEKILPVGETVLVSGKVEWFNGRPSMVHPDHVVSLADAESLPLVEPVYPLTAGLSPKTLARAVQAGVGALPSLPDWMDRAIASRNGFPSFSEAVEAAHAPRDGTDIDPLSPARRRLAYDELLAGQI